MVFGLLGEPLPAFSGVVLSTRTHFGEGFSDVAIRNLSRLFGPDADDLPRKATPSSRPVGRPSTKIKVSQ